MALRMVTPFTAGATRNASTPACEPTAGPRPTEFQARLIVAGRVRAMGGRPGPYVVTAAAIQRAVEQGLFNGLACFVDHSAGHPSVRDLLGVWHDVIWDDAGAAAVGQLRVFETAATRPVVDLLAQWLAGEARPDLGISLVFYPSLAEDGRRIVDLVMVESADVVMFPAVDGARLEGRAAGPGQGQKERRMTPERVAGAARRLGAETFDSHSQFDRREQAGREREQDSREREQNSMEDAHMTGDQHKTKQAEKAGANGAAAGASGAAEEQAITPEQAVAMWQAAIHAAAAEALIAASGLPGVVQKRLRDRSYDSPEQVEQAVDGARAELAALNEGGVVRLGQRPPHEMWLSDPLDRARDLVGFFFGDAEAAAPPPNLRSFSDLYVALTGDVHFRGVFDGTRVQFAGATTATLPNLAVDAMNKVIVQQFQALDHYRWYERITSVEPNDGTLQAMQWITLGGVGNLPAVNEGAAYTELAVADVKESAAFVKRGGYVGITREMIKNSAIQQLQAIPRALAVAAVRTRSSAVAALFSANAGVGPTLAQDNKALFHLDHGNLATTAFGTDATAWRAARAECFRQAEVGTGKPLGIFPRYVLVPSELYDGALSVLGYGEGMPATYSPEAVGRGFADPRPVPLVVPDWTDATDWAYVVDPAVFPVIQMSYSQQPGGRRHPAPELFAVVSETSGLMFANDILPVKVRDEFALGVNGHRGIGKRNVA
jgi:hypothetical protein